jgi:hypothetical protein
MRENYEECLNSYIVRLSSPCYGIIYNYIGQIH